VSSEAGDDRGEGLDARGDAREADDVRFLRLEGEEPPAVAADEDGWMRSLDWPWMNPRAAL
jgi:hypothetical protein